MNAFARIDTMIDKVLKVAIIIITIIVVTAMTLQVCGRYFIPLPINGLDEFTGHTAVWFYMLGAAYSASKSDHIKADMLEVFHVPVKAQHIISIFASIVSIVISGFMIAWSYRYVQWSVAGNEVTPGLRIPAVYFQSAILVGAVLLFIYFIKELVNRILHKQPLVEEEFESQITNQ